MSTRILASGLLPAILMVVATPHASATLFSGNPVADAWTAAGVSLTSGNSYVGGAPDNGNGDDSGTPYNLYKNTTTAGNILAECNIACTAWVSTDTIVGLGAVFPNVSGTNNAALVFLKWGVTSSNYSLSTFSTPAGNGRRDFDIGQGGFGSVMATLNRPLASGYSTPTTALQWVGSVQSLPAPLTNNYVVLNSIIVGGVFQSFEGYLNVTRLNAANATSFVYNGNSIVGVRTSTSNLFLETNALVEGVPEPSTGLLAGGALLAAWLVRRRR